MSGKRLTPKEKKLQDGAIVQHKDYKKLEKKLDDMCILQKAFIKEAEVRIKELEKTAMMQEPEAKYMSRQILLLQEHFNRMESGLLQEFRMSQDIMKTMIEHDLSVERAKLEFQIQMDATQQEMDKRTRETKEREKEERRKLRFHMYKQFGFIVLPILTALATGITLWIQHYFK